MKIIRSSNHTLKFATDSKNDQLDRLFHDFRIDLEFYIKLILNKELPLKKNLSSKELPINLISGGRYRQLIYKHASEILRSQIKRASETRFKRYKKVYKYMKSKGKLKDFTNKRFKDLNLKEIIYTRFFTFPDIKNLSINFDQRFLNFETSFEFDEFINLKLPYIKEGYKSLQESVNLPIKYHKHSLKFLTWNRKNSVQIRKINGTYYTTFVYEKEIEDRKIGNSIGIDIGYNKLLACSDGKILGSELKNLYLYISNKIRGSKKYKKSLKFRTNLVNQICNKLDISQLKQLVVEDLKNVKKNSKFSKKLNNKMQYWIYKQVLLKLERLCENNGIKFIKVDPAYTSQTCSNCGTIDKQNRKGESYQCVTCGFSMDADINAAINILHRGVYSPSTNQNIICLE